MAWDDIAKALEGVETPSKLIKASAAPSYRRWSLCVAPISYDPTNLESVWHLLEFGAPEVLQSPGLIDNKTIRPASRHTSLVGFSRFRVEFQLLSG